MLKYEIKLTDDSFKQEELVWSEKYLAPDLSFITGVTSQNYHLEKFNRLSLTNKIVNNNNSSAQLETENVIRQGYIAIKDKVYEVNSGSVTDYSVVDGGTPINYYYLFLNGKYYYAYETDGYKFTIKDWLVKEGNKVVNGTIEVTKETDSEGKDIVKIDTITWIEDGLVSIDGHEYFFDNNEEIAENKVGGLKYYEDGKCLDTSAITSCSDIEYYPFESVNDYLEVTKFKLTKQEEINEIIDKITFCKRFFYASYKNNYFPVRKDGDNFKCDIPNYLLGMEDNNPTESDYYRTVEKIVSAITDDSNTIEEITGNTFDVLLTCSPYIEIEGKRIYISYDYMNANDGKMLSIYLVGDTSNIAIGDKIRIVDTSASGHTQYVQLSSDTKYNFSSNDKDFILFNSKKYKLEKNLCDKVLINGNEYSIEYNNGKVVGKDCLVLIDGEEVPMKIINDSDESGKLERYGKIISGTSKSAITATYDIVPYSGVTVDDEKYVVVEEKTLSIDQPTEGESSYDVSYYAYLDRNNEYTFMVTDKLGSSMLVCIPYLNPTDFTEEFSDFISRQICEDVVDNQMYMLLYTKNKMFGDKEITEELAFQVTEKPVSSDDYFNLFDNLEIFVKNGYIHIPLSLVNAQGDNLMQDDIVENRFFEEVKRRSINSIVDMEKDVYYPKYINNSDESIKQFLDKTTITDNERKEYQHQYIGSYTDFEIIKEIRINPHFRTRNMDSWKVEDGYNDVAASANTDNWFIMDMNPYRRIFNNTANLYEYNDSGTAINKITDKATALNILYNTPDLLWLLDFTDDDVYYQKSKLAKTFIRFTYYDSTNPQIQSLLATSTVFMDEHRLFKKFIDNSRKNVNDYGMIDSVEYKIDENGKYEMVGGIPQDIASGTTMRKVSVRTEYLGARRENRNKYIKKSNDYKQKFDGTIIDDKHRLGCDFIINNKIATDTSSEGYYLYIFREYSENLTPKPIYMKVEFNHAGIGRTIPFLIPMRWSDETDADKYKTPVSALTFNGEDLPLFKKGIKLEDVYAQTYIPLYAVYDFKNKEYAYVFDDRYVNAKDNVVTLNMFELKIQNEEGEVTENMQKEITKKQQVTAKININENQFPQR